MKNDVLPYDIRVEVMDLMDQGYDNNSIHGKVLHKAAEHVKSDRQLTRCISTIRGHHNKGRRPQLKAR